MLLLTPRLFAFPLPPVFHDGVSRMYIHNCILHKLAKNEQAGVTVACSGETVKPA